MSTTLESRPFRWPAATFARAILNATARALAVPLLAVARCAAGLASRGAAGSAVRAGRIGDTLGKRETCNSRRIFFSEANREQFVACDVLADAFQDEATVGLLEDLCGIAARGQFAAHRILSRHRSASGWSRTRTSAPNC